jgi:hypothetical protein
VSLRETARPLGVGAKNTTFKIVIAEPVDITNQRQGES